MALRGSWNRSPISGAKIVFLEFDNDDDTVANAVHEFCNGFIRDSNDAATRWARPVGLLLSQDGSVYITSDDIKEFILKLTPPTSTSVDEDVDMGAVQIRVEPNPVRGDLGLELEGFVFPARLDIVDMQGETISSHEVEASSMLIDTSGIPQGAYVVRLTDGVRSASRTVSIVR